MMLDALERAFRVWIKVELSHEKPIYSFPKFQTKQTKQFNTPIKKIRNLLVPDKAGKFSYLKITKTFPIKVFSITEFCETSQHEYL